MKKKKKEGIRTVVFLLLVLQFFMMPTANTQVFAASQLNWYDGGSEAVISVEAGNQFYIGDFLFILSGSDSSTVSLAKASYRSSAPKVASVNGKGLLKAKRAGTTDITVQCQGMTSVCHLTVEKKGAFELKNDPAVKSLTAAAKTLAKGMPKSLTAAKGFSFRQKRDRYLWAYEADAMKKLSYDGFLYEKERPAPMADGDYKRSEKLAVPQAGRYLTAESLLRRFMQKNDPSSVKSSKTMRIASASAASKSSKITIRLRKKADAAQILAAQLAYPKENDASVGKSKAVIRISIYDQTARIYYKGSAVLKKGSSQITVTPQRYRGRIYQNADLISGHVYMLGSSMNWAGGYKVTAK